MSKKVKKRFQHRKLVAGLLAVVMIAAVVFVVGCTSRDENLVGRWVFEESPDWVTTFNADGTGIHAQSWGYGTSFQWSTRGNNIRWNYSGHPNMDSPYRLSGNTLDITMDDGTVYRYIRD